jgi:pimeloyl-ACP methyl ester carboxylesterase
VLAKVTAPTLILRRLGNITVSHQEADVFEHWLLSAPSFIKKYPKAGHYPYVEIEPEVSHDIRAFLAGQLDGQLRRTARLPLAEAPEAPHPPS